MALTLVAKKKQQQILILVLVAVLLITVTVLWLGFFKKEPVVITEPQSAVRVTPQQVEVNFGVLSLPLLQELDSPAEPVQEPDRKGRSNPFLPF
jgi:flagellar basal body-associated protein FliL